MLQIYLQVRGERAIPARDLSRLTSAAIGSLSLRMGIETRGMSPMDRDKHILLNGYVRTEDVVNALLVKVRLPPVRYFGWAKFNVNFSTVGCGTTSCGRPCPPGTQDVDISQA